MQQIWQSNEALTISALHGAPLLHIFKCLDCRSLCSASQACKDWSAAGTSDELWLALASLKWPRKTLLLKPSYRTFQELFKDDNKASACPTIDLSKLSKCSAYKYNRASYYFQCNLTSLQWDRAAKHIRLCFEARGDIDLRHPDSSHAAVVMTKPEHNYLSAGSAQPRSSDLVQTAKAEACELWVCSDRHIKGCLVWTEEGLLQSPLSDLQSQQQGFWRTDTSLVFCYANAVVSGPYLDADCKSVELLKIPAQEDFADAFLASCTTFELPHAPCEALKCESDAEARVRWQGLPEAVQNNPQWWG